MLQVNQILDGRVKCGMAKKFEISSGIRNLEKKTALSSDVLAAKAFEELFLKIVNENGFSKDDVYNADETRLNWEFLPRKSLSPWHVLTIKTNRQRVSVMVNANTSKMYTVSITSDRKIQESKLL